MQPSLTLYHYWRSSCSWRVRWVLAYKNVSYQSVTINLLKNEQRSPAYLAKNPNGLVPSLDVNGRVLSESLAIIEWLEESYPQQPILPRDPWERACARELASIVATGIQPLQNLRVLHHYSAEPQAREEWSRHFIAAGLSQIESKLQGVGGAFALGSDLTLADIYLVPQVYNALRFQIPMSDYPRCQAIYEHCLRTPACEQAAPHNQPDAVL